MKNMSFKSYLESKGAIRLDEGLKEIKPMIWPDMDLYTAVTVLQNSPAWTPAQMRGKMDLPFKSEDDMRAFVQFVTSLYGTAFGSPYSEETGWDTSAWYGKLIKMTGAKHAASGEASFKMTSPARQDGEDDKSYRKRSEQKFSKEFGSVMAVMKIAAPESMRYVRRDKASPETVVMATDDAEAAAKIFRVVRYVEGLSDEELKAAMAEKRIDDGRLAAAATDEEIRSELKTKKSDAVQTLEVESYFNGLFKCYEIYDYLRKGGDKSSAGRDKYIQGQRPGKLAPLLGVPKQLASGTQMAMSRSNYSKLADGFDKAVNMTADIDEVSRWMLKAANQLLKPGEAQKSMEKLSKERAFLQDQIKNAKGADEKKKYEEQLAIAEKAYADAEEASKVTPDNLQEYLDSKHIGSAVARYENARRVNIADIARRKAEAKEKNKPFDENAEKKKIPEQIINLRSFDQVLSSRKTDEGRDEAPEFGNACAERRMKLFAAAVAKGAVIWTSKNWVICKTTQTEQGLVFGRNKPKVEPGTNNIIAAANLEDSEGITARNRAIRDGSGEFVKDGIGFDYRMNETGWCTASRFYGRSTGRVPWEHTDSTSGGSYWSNGMRLVIMDCRTGRLYQYGNNCFLDEEDGQGGVIADTKASGNAAYTAVKQAYPELDSLIRRSGVDKIMFSGVAATDPESLFAEACQANLITRNGGIIISDQARLRRYYPMLHMVSEIIVLGPTARLMFTTTGQLDISGVMQFPPIDCRNVADASEMFSGANTTDLTLRNTGGIVNMRRMFSGARINSVTGLDTSGAEDITEMFCNCRLLVYKFMQMPEFDLKSCEKMDRAFSGSALRLIHLKNADRVKTAVDAFSDCFMLENVPEANFPQITAGSQLASGFKSSRKSKFADDFSKLFAGCAKLPRTLKDGYQKQLDALKSWYAERESSENRDSDTLVVNSQDDIQQNLEWLYEYKVVKLGKCDTENLFYGTDGVRIKTLDVNGHENIDNLFYGCEISQIDEIVGTERVKSARGMFRSCQLKSPPAMQLPALVGEMNVYYDMKPPLGMPYVEFGVGVKSFADFDYTNDQNHGGICKRMLGQYSGQWISQFGATKCVQKLFQNMYESNQEKLLKSLATDERGYLVVTDGMAPQLAEILTVKKDVPGIVLRFEKPESGKALFAHKRMPSMPKIDFENRLVDCDSMFRECTVSGEWGGLENTKNVEQATRMFFKTSVPRSEISPFDVSGVKYADYMFYDCGTRDGARIGGSGKWEFKSVETGNSMFDGFGGGVVIDNVLLGDKLKSAMRMFAHTVVDSTKGANCVIKIPTAVRCDGMFQSATFTTPKIKEISLDSAVLNQDAANNGDGLFAYSSGLAEVTELNLPETAFLGFAFAESQSITKIFTINAPKAVAAPRMFADCARFGGVMIWDSPISHAQAMCVGSPASGIYGVNGEYLIARNKLLAKGKI